MQGARIPRPGLELSAASLPGLPSLLAVAPRRFRFVAPRYRPHPNELIAHTGALGFRVEARGADRFPAIEYDGAPGFRGLDPKADDVSPSALVANGRDHSSDLEPRRQLKKQISWLHLTPEADQPSLAPIGPRHLLESQASWPPACARQNPATSHCPAIRRRRIGFAGPIGIAPDLAGVPFALGRPWACKLKAATQLTTVLVAARSIAPPDHGVAAMAGLAAVDLPPGGYVLSVILGRRTQGWPRPHINWEASDALAGLLVGFP